MKEWACAECGQTVTARDKPTTIQWNDGHCCRFWKEIKIEKGDQK
jgi:hypothetical protein